MPDGICAGEKGLIIITVCNVKEARKALSPRLELLTTNFHFFLGIFILCNLTILSFSIVPTSLSQKIFFKLNQKPKTILDNHPREIKQFRFTIGEA
jgi:hypothetical protein